MNYEIVALVINGEDFNFWEPILLTAGSTRSSDAGIRNIIETARYDMARGIRLFHKSKMISSIYATNPKGSFYKTACSPGIFGSGKNNGLLPIDVIAFLEDKMKFFSSAKIDNEEPEGHGVEVDPKTGAPKDW